MVDFDQLHESAGELEQLGDLLAEYEILGHLRAAIRRALVIDPSAPNGQTWLERVSFLFDSLQRHLERMFRIESFEGHLGEMRADPEFAARVDQFELDRQRLRDSVTSLSEAMHTTPPDDAPNVADLRGRLAEMLAAVESHEEAELNFTREHFWRGADPGGE